MYKYPFSARNFVYKFWFNHPKGLPAYLCKAVTEILLYVVDGKLTIEGRKAYRNILLNTTNNKQTREIIKIEED